MIPSVTYRSIYNILCIDECIECTNKHIDESADKCFVQDKLYLESGQEGQQRQNLQTEFLVFQTGLLSVEEQMLHSDRCGGFAST